MEKGDVKKSILVKPEESSLTLEENEDIRK